MRMKMFDMSSILIQHLAKTSINCFQKGYKQTFLWKKTECNAKEAAAIEVVQKNPDQVFFGIC